MLSVVGQQMQNGCSVPSPEIRPWLDASDVARRVLVADSDAEMLAHPGLAFPTIRDNVLDTGDGPNVSGAVFTEERCPGVLKRMETAGADLVKRGSTEAFGRVLAQKSAKGGTVS